MAGTEYAEALEFLYGLQRFGLRPGLETTRQLVARAGEAHRGLRFIHVAGTNGKGSTCAFLESVYRRAGYRVGLYTSPHLVSFRERIRLDGEAIPEAEVAAFVRESRGWLGELAGAGAGEATFFEWVTVLALVWLGRRGCDVVVWETGMGGRWDATNVVTPLASVITNVGWDHMQWLGDTLAKIAGEKAGIIKPGVPALTAAREPEVLEVLRAKAGECGSPLEEVTEASEVFGVVGGWRLGLRGRHQVWNAALALATVRRLQGVLPVPGEVVRPAMESAHWPGRFEVWQRGGGTVVLDGAHNRPAFEVLATTLREEYPGRRYSLVVGLLADKDAGAMMEHLLPEAGRVVVVPIHASRGGDPGELVSRCRGFLGGRRPGVVVERADGLREALDLCAGDGLVVVTGSLYLVGEALGMLAGETSSERGLNDWGRRQ